MEYFERIMEVAEKDFTTVNKRTIGVLEDGFGVFLFTAILHL